MGRRIKSINFYQAVMLEGESNSLKSFAPDEFKSDAALKKNTKAEETPLGVLLTSATGGQTLVPYNNVAYVQFIKESPTEAKPAKSK